MLTATALLWTQAFATLALVGLIWVIQLVHYPLMAQVGDNFASFHEQHCRRISWIVGPLMATEAVTAIALVAETPPGVPSEWVWIGIGLVTVIWLTTALVSMPLHARLARGVDPRALGRLVTTNWIRTAAWTARGVLVLMMAAHARP